MRGVLLKRFLIDSCSREGDRKCSCEVALLDEDTRYVVRNFKKGDEVRLAEIFSECFRPTTISFVKRWLRRAGVLPEHMFVGEVRDTLVSVMVVEFKKLHLGEEVFLKTGGIGAVCTDSDYRRKGIMTNLIKQALSYLRQNGVSNSALFTDLDIPAHRIYSRLGFVDVATARSFVKFFDYPFVFKQWIRRRNRLLKYAKMARRRLHGWERSVVIEIKDVGTLSFRFKRGRFQMLKKPPRTPDVVFSTDLLTCAREYLGAMEWEEAVRTGRIVFRKGESADIEVVKRIFTWEWEEPLCR